MKALTLTQPWASLVACGAKPLETRSWWTSHRGELAIHAAKGMTRTDWARVDAEPFCSRLRAAGDVLAENASDRLVEIPRGSIVALVEVVDCFEIAPYFVTSLSDEERLFGIFEPGRYAWQLANVRRLEQPVPCVGRQRIFNLSPRVAAAVAREVRSAAS